MTIVTDARLLTRIDFGHDDEPTIRQLGELLRVIAVNGMFEELAVRYVNQPQSTLDIIRLSFLIVGGIIAGATWKGTDALPSAPYFAWTGILIVAVYAQQLIWLDFPSAVVGGYLWVFIIIDAIAPLAGGFAISVIAMARSRDAYGHPRMAVLAFVPIANLWLLLKSSRQDLSPSRMPLDPFFGGAFGVVTGFAVMFGGIGLRNWLPGEIEARVMQWIQTDEGMAAGTRMTIQLQGLEATIRTLSAEMEVPMPVDDITTIFETRAEGTTFRYIYKVDSDLSALDGEFLSMSANYWCSYEPLLPIIREGGTIAESYFNVNYKLIGVASADAATCGLQ